jgi:hypothetical protein
LKKKGFIECDDAEGSHERVSIVSTNPFIPIEKNHILAPIVPWQSRSYNLSQSRKLVCDNIINTSYIFKQKP